MKDFFDDNFLLKGDVAVGLYREVRDLPIYDYHCHLSPEEIYLDRRFDDIGCLWLEADHYKWRLMRAAGVDEKYITSSDASYKEKFEQFARILPDFAGNPVYHWAHLELKRYFGITLPICEENAEEIWQRTSRAMADGAFSARRLIVSSGVKTVITTDDPTSDLKYHKLLRAEEDRFEVLPCLRCDNVVNIERSGSAGYLRTLGKTAAVEIKDFSSLKKALETRVDYFVANGCTAADVSFEDFPRGKFDEKAADRCLHAVLGGEKPSAEALADYKFCVLVALASMFEKRDMVMQMHVGVMRNVNTGRYLSVGADCGGDSLANAVDVRAASALLDNIALGGMPKTVIYTLNPNSYYPLATLLGDFWGGGRGRLQLGAAWWFMDNRDGIREQLRIFANTGGLGLFNGMLTDSRSFVSYARHDYFRRILCSLVGEWIEDGEYPNDAHTVEMLKNICYFNARGFFGGKK